MAPLSIWFLAFVIWFYWSDLAKLFSNDRASTRTLPKAFRKTEMPERAETPAEKRAQEKILDEDREKLNAILKERR